MGARAWATLMLKGREHCEGGRARKKLKKSFLSDKIAPSIF